MTTGPASFPLQDLRADLSGRRAIVYGAVGDPGRAIVAALLAAGARVGLTGVTTDGAALFALKRAASDAPAQVVDFANPASVRVATRKLAKALGGLDVAVVVPPPAATPQDTTGVLRIAAREIDLPPIVVPVVKAASPPSCAKQAGASITRGWNDSGATRGAPGAGETVLSDLRDRICRVASLTMR